MPYAFDDAFRRLVAARCAAFPRLAGEVEGGLNRAAVTITLVETGDASGEAAFLMTRRAARLRSHSGQWALPGGRCDEGETATEAALRELEEEIGLRLDATSVLGTLDDYATRSGYLITPVVVWAGDKAHIAPNPKEVASVHRIALAQIMRPDAVDFHSIPESDRKVIRLYFNGRSLHAPTAALLYQFREMLDGRITRVADLEQPVFAWR